MRKVEISHKTIIFTFVFLLSAWFLYYIRDIVLQLFVALLLVAILSPIVEKLSKYKIPKAISILLSYIVVFGVFGMAIGSIIPPLVEQTTNLANTLPNYLQSLGIGNIADGEIIKEALSQLGSVPGQIVKTGFSIFANILNILTVLIFSFYLLLIRDKFDNNLEFLFGKSKGQEVNTLVDSIEKRLGGWARGQLLLMLSIGVLSYIGFMILGIPYALPLAVLAGIFEIIPYLGPLIAAIPAVILGFSISPFMGFAVLALGILIQQIENYLLVPKIMEKSTGVSPIITLLGLAIGFRLAGVVGMIISVPIVIVLLTFWGSRFGKN